MLCCFAQDVPEVPVVPEVPRKDVPLVPEVPVVPDHPNLLFRTNHAIQIPGWDDRWITDCWSVIHAKQYKILWTGESRDENYYKKNTN